MTLEGRCIRKELRNHNELGGKHHREAIQDRKYVRRRGALSISRFKCNN